MKKGKAVGPNELSVEVWKCLGEMVLKYLTRLFKRLLMGERMPEEWRRSVLIPIYKNKGDAQCCGSYRGIKLISHTMKIWERIIEARLRDSLEISKQQYGFMPEKATTDAKFALRMLMEKYWKGQRASLCICEPTESLQQGSTRRAVVLYEKIRNGRKIYVICTGYVCEGKQNSGEVCSRNY